MFVTNKKGGGHAAGGRCRCHGTAGRAKKGVSHRRKRQIASSEAGVLQAGIATGTDRKGFL